MNIVVVFVHWPTGRHRDHSKGYPHRTGRWAACAVPVDDDEFIGCIRASLPYAWQVISDVAGRLARGTGAFADHSIPPPSEAERGQLLRALASDAIRTALERHFGAVLAFQNCHRVAAFDPDRLGADYARFVSARAQLLNQSPELRDC